MEATKPRGLEFEIERPPILAKPKSSERGATGGRPYWLNRARTHAAARVIFTRFYDGQSIRVCREGLCERPR